MASMRHDFLVELFKNRPTFATELLTDSLHVPQPTFDEARLASIDLTEVQPAEYRADVVVVLYHNDKPIRVNIVEVQLGIDPDKPYAWPAYLAVSREKHRCLADLLIIAPDPVVANWCARRIEIGVPGFALVPPVLRAEFIPVVTDPDEAARSPELVLMSAMAYGDTDQATEIAKAALSAFVNLDGKRAGIYLDMLYRSINEAARRALELMMKNYEFVSPFAKQHIQLGRDEGVKLGRDEGFALALLTLLEVRGISVPGPTRERIIAERDMAQLKRWLERAATARTLADVLADPS